MVAIFLKQPLLTHAKDRDDKKCAADEAGPEPAFRKDNNCGASQYHQASPSQRRRQNPENLTSRPQVSLWALCMKAGLRPAVG